ncbi:uncharacterized protein LOC119105412 [Pollicipes pollicipes]|uniref:uncharacterized protein LOC119105412 n=1 Tax=Pollicipes pollicipes TaxID=41117 RepID=UPI0018852655|nr:uncharacterized protein LOC119105412 [Pollicipes pollicipes]
MSGLWLVASIVYMAEIVGRNMDYLFRERGFPLKILTAVLALAAACLDAALCLLSHRHRSAIYSPQLKAAPSVESGARPAQLTIGTPPAHEATQRSSFGGVEARPERHRMERAPSSPPFVARHPGDVEEPLAVAGTKFASTDYLASDPANLSFSQRLKMLEQRKANGKRWQSELITCQT